MSNKENIRKIQGKLKIVNGHPETDYVYVDYDKKLNAIRLRSSSHYLCSDWFFLLNEDRFLAHEMCPLKEVDVVNGK